MPLVLSLLAGTPAPTDVRIVESAWTAPFPAADLASALKLRLAEGTVSVGDCGAGQACVRSSAADPRVLVVERGEERVEVPIDATEPEEAARRVAILIATIVREPVPVRTPAATPRAWSVGALVGPAIAIADDDASATVALTLRARRRLGDSPASLDFGAKLSGAYAAQSNATKASVSDRAVFAGLGWDQAFSPAWGSSFSGGMQYTHPLIDRDEGSAEIRNASPSSRFGARVGADLVWSPQPSISLTLGAATTWLFAEREYTLTDGSEFLDLGFMTVDVAAGALVRF